MDANEGKAQRRYAIMIVTTLLLLRRFVIMDYVLTKNALFRVWIRALASGQLRAYSTEGGYQPGRCL
jgi:hypothetical protein